MASISWSGCGCIQRGSDADPAAVAAPGAEADSGNQPEFADDLAEPPAVDALGAGEPEEAVVWDSATLEGFFSLNDKLESLPLVLESMLHAGEERWLERDPLHVERVSFLEILQAASAADADDTSLLKAAIVLVDTVSRVSEGQVGGPTKSQLIDASESYLDRAAAEGHAAAQLLPDVIDYYRGMHALERARMADNESDIRQYAGMARGYFLRSASNRTSAFYHRAVEGAVAACIEGAGSCSIPDEVERFIAVYPDYTGIPRLLLARANALLQNGETDKAQRAFDEIEYDYPWSDAAIRATAIMDENGMARRSRSYDETLEHVDFLRRKRFWSFAEKAAQSALSEYPDDPRLLMEDARIQYEQSHYAPAIEKFRKLAEVLGGEKRDNIRPATVTAYLYRAYGYEGNCDQALTLQAENLTRLGKKDRLQARLDYALTCGKLDVVWENAKALQESLSPWDFGFYAYLAKEYETARPWLSLAVDSLGGTYRRRAKYFFAQATLKAALRAEEQNAAQDAALQPADPAKSMSKSSKNKKKSAKKSKNALPVLPAATVKLARSLFEELISTDPNDYYALLAYSRLLELDGGGSLQNTPLYMPGAGSPADFGAGSSARPIQKTFAFEEAETMAGGDTDAWLHKMVAQYGKIWPQLGRIEMLHRIGLYAERNEEFRPILIEGNAIARLGKRPTAANLWFKSLSIDGHLVDNRSKEAGVWGISLDEKYFVLPDKKDKVARNTLAEHQQLVFDHRTEIRAFLDRASVLFHDYYLARKYISNPSSIPGTPKDNDVWSIIYPHAYNHAIVSESSKNGISPYLLWTLMNIESAFNPDSVSYADAFGLLQIIPITGYKLADALGVDPFGPYDLIRPELSIQMGAWYFGTIVNKFHGYATLSMAGYNGGPFQVARWITAYAGQMEHDAFIELIPLREARNYVKKGLARLLIFLRIDEANPKYYYYVPNSLPDNFEEMPNF